MRTVEASATLAASPEAIWEVLGHPARWGEWLTIHKSWKGAVPAEATAGLSATAAATVMNMPISIDWTFTHVDAPRSITLGGITRARVTLALTITITEAADGSEVDIKASVDGGMIDGPMGGVFRSSLTGAMNRSLENVRQLAA
jgi:carbon monoxide dehydrogenase subunit G